MQHYANINQLTAYLRLTLHFQLTKINSILCLVCLLEANYLTVCNKNQKLGLLSSIMLTVSMKSDWFRMSDLIGKCQRMLWFWPDFAFQYFGDGKEHDCYLKILHSFTESVRYFG